MSALSVLEDVEDFLRKDLATEVLSTRVKKKRAALLNKVTACISNTKEQEKIDGFLAKQREVARLQSSDSERSKSMGKAASDEDDGDYYMDLTEISDAPGSGLRNQLAPPAPEDYGSGSGYESYDSDEESSARPKSSKEVDLSSYFSASDYDIFTYIYLENKNKFLKGKKWLKRIGTVKENHLKCYKKPGESTAVLDVPLRGYNTTLKNKEGTSSIIIVLSTVSDGDAHRFYVDRGKIEEWSKVLREKTLSLADASDLPPPPVAARPASTLPRAATQTNGSMQHSSVHRTHSVGKSDKVTGAGDAAVFTTDLSPPPVPPGHPSLTSSSTQINHISKGLKSAMTDMFKKDKTKKRISSAENLGATFCGNLMVFDNKWAKKWCLVKRNQLVIYGKEESPEQQIELQGCSILAHPEDPQRPFAFRILNDGKEVAFLEASSSDEKGKWIGALNAEAGSADPQISEPEYMPIEETSPMTKNPFNSRKESVTKISGKSTFYQGDTEEDVYLDLAADSQISLQTTSPQKIFSLPLPPTLGRTSKSHSVPSETTTLEGVLEKKNKKTKKGTKSSEKSDVKTEKVSEGKKEKQKEKKKEKRRLTSPAITSPTQSKSVREITVIREPYSPEGETTVDGEVNGTSNEPNEGKSVLETIIQKRRKELATQKAEIKTKLLTLKVKKDELNKYIEAAPTDKERGRLRSMLQRVTEEHSKLEKEDVSLELEIRKLNDKSYDINSPANKRPPPREKKTIHTGATGNVLSKAQMWEAGNRK